MSSVAPLAVIGVIGKDGNGLRLCVSGIGDVSDFGSLFPLSTEWATLILFVMVSDELLRLRVETLPVDVVLLLFL